MQALVPIGTFKVRFARPGAGKSGGVRIIYFHCKDHKPILLLLTYAKADQQNLTDVQKMRLKKCVDNIIGEFIQDPNNGRQVV